MEKSKNSTQILPYFIWKGFSTKFGLDAEVQNRASWNISNLGLCGNSLALNIILKSEWIFWNAKIISKM